MTNRFIFLRVQISVFSLCLAGALAVGSNLSVQAQPESASVPYEEPVVDSVAAAKYLPHDTLAFARIGDVVRFRETWENFSFAAQLNDPQLKKFFDDAFRRMGRVSQGLGIDLIGLIQSVDGELSLASLENSKSQLSFVAVAEFEDDAAAATWLDRLEKKLEAESAEPTHLTVNSTELRSWRRTAPEAYTNLSYFRNGNHIVFADQLQTLAETANAAGDSDFQSLADNPNFQHVMSRVAPAGDSSGLNWYGHPQGLVEAAISANLGGEAPPEVVEFLEPLGLDQIRGLGGTYWFGQGGMDSVSTTYGYVETPVRGALKALTLPATPQTPPQWVKDDVSIYSQINWSVERLFDTLREVVDAHRGPGSFDDMMGAVPVAGGRATLAELAEAIDGPLQIAGEIPQDARALLQQKLVIGFGIKNDALIRGMIRDVAEQAGGKTETVGKAEMIRVPMELGQIVPELGGFAKMEVGVAVTDDAVLFSPNADYLADTFGEARAKLRPLSESPEYQQIAAQFPENTSMINYQRQDGRLEGLYENLRSGFLNPQGIPMIAGGVFNFDFTTLPEFPAMSRYLQTTGSFIVPEEDGFRIVNLALPPREQD